MTRLRSPAFHVAVDREDLGVSRPNSTAVALPLLQPSAIGPAPATIATLSFSGAYQFLLFHLLRHAGKKEVTDRRRQDEGTLKLRRGIE